MLDGTHLAILGSRGSIPVSGERFTTYGGGTTCFVIADGSDVLGFVDVGTSLGDLGQHNYQFRDSLDILLTHYHWDHIQGISMLSEMWAGSLDISITGPGNPKQALVDAISPPVFPVSIARARSVRYRAMDGRVEVGGLSVSRFAINHPQGAAGYRIDGRSQSIAIVTDHEAGSDLDGSIQEAVKGVDILIHDAQYLPEEREQRSGWGHSSYEEATAAAIQAGAGRLILASHDPGRTDVAVDAIVERARGLFPNTDGARPGMELQL